EADDLADRVTANLHGGGADQGRSPTVTAKPARMPIYRSADPAANPPAAGERAPKAAPAEAAHSGGPAPPGAEAGTGGETAKAATPGAETWPQAKAALMAGRAPALGLLPESPGNAAGCRRLDEIKADENLPPE